MRSVREIDRISRFSGFLGVTDLVVEIEGEAQPITRQVVERSDAVAVLLRDPGRDECLLVRQIRPAHLRHQEPWLVEVVAGAVDSGETPEQAARREVLEETGYRVGDVRDLGWLYPSPGGLSERIQIYYAEIASEDRQTEGGGIDGEDIECVWLSVSELIDKVLNGDLKDAKTQVSVLKAVCLHLLAK